MSLLDVPPQALPGGKLHGTGPTVEWGLWKTRSFQAPGPLVPLSVLGPGHFITLLQL